MRKPLICPFPQLPPIVGYAKTATIRSTQAHELDAKTMLLQSQLQNIEARDEMVQAMGSRPD